jgi:hypothetical protein
MGCCSPFSAVATAAAADPSRHVNFTAGMVLGVDDYRQEFAYHSARDKWIVRDFLGYGTLSGLAVSVEDDGTNGPRVRVTPGAAAAPSGQLICVGREQCGSFNAWLQRDEIKEELRKKTDGTPDPDHTTLNLFLTLCYVDCAVAEVPIPGEPCRSDENLMAPSRIADDYSLNFAFESPPMAEADAVPALEAFLTRLNVANGNPSDAAGFANALRIAEIQLRLALGIYPAESPEPAANDLLPVPVHPDFELRFRTALKRLWVTRLRPQVQAQRCGTETVAANDCVLLAQLWLPVVRAANQWGVDGEAKVVVIDESARPVLLSPGIAQSPFGALVLADATGQGFEFFDKAGDISAKTRVAIVRSDVAINVKVPGAGKNIGAELSVKAGGKGEITLTTPTKTTIDGKNELKLAARGAASLVSDGAGTWHITGLVK